MGTRSGRIAEPYERAGGDQATREIVGKPHQGQGGRRGCMHCDPSTRKVGRWDGVPRRVQHEVAWRGGYHPAAAKKPATDLLGRMDLTVAPPVAQRTQGRGPPFALPSREVEFGALRTSSRERSSHMSVIKVIVLIFEVISSYSPSHTCRRRQRRPHEIQAVDYRWGEGHRTPDCPSHGSGLHVGRSQ